MPKIGHSYLFRDVGGIKMENYDILIDLIAPEELFLKQKNILYLKYSNISDIENLVMKTGASYFIFNRINFLLSSNGRMPELIISPAFNLSKTIAIREMIAVQNCLAVNNIDFLFFKGVCTEYQLYKRDVCRSLSDIDVLVPYSMMEHTMNLLCKKGYYPVSSKTLERISVSEALSQTTRHIILNPEHGKYPLELHYKFSKVDDEKLKSDTYFSEFNANKTLVNVLENNFFYIGFM